MQALWRKGGSPAYELKRLFFYPNSTLRVASRPPVRTAEGERLFAGGAVTRKELRPPLPDFSPYSLKRFCAVLGGSTSFLSDSLKPSSVVHALFVRAASSQAYLSSQAHTLLCKPVTLVAGASNSGAFGKHAVGACSTGYMCLRLLDVSLRCAAGG